jgi:hypothetical protein
MSNKMSDKAVLNEAHHILLSALRGNKKDQMCIITLSTDFQIYSPNWIDNNTPQWMVVYHSDGPSVVINNSL